MIISTEPFISSYKFDSSRVNWGNGGAIKLMREFALQKYSALGLMSVRITSSW